MVMKPPPLVLPPAPDRPDCCAGGCAICVLEDYVDEMAAWRAECARLEAEHAAAYPDSGSADT